MSEPIVRQPDFAEELRALLNRHSVENRSDTPDFILAAFLQNVLIDYEHAVKARDRWYERPLEVQRLPKDIPFEETQR